MPSSTIMNQSGQVEVQLPDTVLWAVWNEDGTVLTAAGTVGRSGEMRIIKLDGHVETFSAPEAARAFAFLPDGRILVARTVGLR